MTLSATHRFLCAAGALWALGVGGAAQAEVPVTSTVRRLPVANGYGAVLLDLADKRLDHFREHPFASEEPLLDGAGKELWSGNQPLAVHTRDLLYDAYFGLRAGGKQAWLTADPVDLGASGYLGAVDGAAGGTAVAMLAQSRGDLALTTYVWAPRALAHAGFVMALRVRNMGAATATGLSAFSLHNFHLGFGRPGVMSDIGENGETVANVAGDLAERGFAGVVVARPLGPVSRRAGSHGAAPPGENLFAIVDGGAPVDLPDLAGEAPTRDGSVSAFQFDLGDLAAGAEQWVGVVFAHHADPFAANAAQGWLDALLASAGADAEKLLAAERAEWKAFQEALVVPAGMPPGDETLYRHSAVVLAMAQVREASAHLREWNSQDGEPRFTRFGTEPGGAPATLPATVSHRGEGAVLASLPPGQWTIAWIRDGAYAAVAMAQAGMHAEARAALAFYLDAEAGRFQGWQELAGYGMPPYQVSLTRYHGFGVEETDFNDFGPNLELDGFGLLVWALGAYERASGDTSLVDASYEIVRDRVANVIVALVEPETGLLRPDSSIWETHWNGRERHWTYTNVTAVRGLCDAAVLAERVGDDASAEKWRAAAAALRTALVQRATDAAGALASNTEELAAGGGYLDAAVLDAVALELFDPKGAVATATLSALEALRVPAGAGWARNDDRFDHAGAEDLSPWGSEYDSGEWVIVDMRGAVAATLAGDDAGAARLTSWVRDQALANYLAVSEVFDEGNGTYKFNHPMAGFGAGAFMLAWQARGRAPDPACGAYHGEAGQGGGGAGGGAGVGGAGGAQAMSEDDGCGCRLAGGEIDRERRPIASLALALGLAILGLRGRARRRIGEVA
jgi:hypothetical protein